MSGNQPPTIYTVAVKAGVSTATVSRVLNNTGNTSPQIEKKVHDAINELGYSPLRRIKPRLLTLGVVVPELTSGRHLEFLAGFDSACTNQPQQPGRMVFSCDGLTDPMRRNDALHQFYESLDAVVLVDPADYGGVDEMLLADKPILLVGQRQKVDAAQLVLNHRKAAKKLISGFVKLGARRIVFVGDHTDNSQFAARFNAVKKSLAKNPDASLIKIHAHQDLPAVIDWFNENEGYFDGCICASDEIALNLMHQLLWRQMTIPKISGWDGIKACDWMVPRLTTIDTGQRQLGSQAAELVMQLLAGELSNERITVDAQLRWRESTGDPKARKSKKS